ncbi:similar to Saccharomyces cerevisiae YKL159C RCN1 Protein involved in calcineurin regulation during calcium signaling [Maudiozyma barnettii]|uniref:Similar to Saccharomyces cerevisiae YKL159C RCN1 Protein involved in calcineurin regulation during calcium signaling n=1 Tax=Maudiozyma barnettii TaxID=61262 RepID=A0A8H2ZHX5_9SACH|nr:Rcn1p [Kazachstania barnettii]CAB4254942.1 similar to Saccharomyces cerevisiae YKL159C RCN1 Protein involved in calcineurin regulation during calcium signaling [Kazachstania barnettii]CAD1783213.1 similar to Saccharomyces cerevisiae YKL159C RCN1 Protein involved in calcineurin regulation during calcium signaling [Kazachstania barnettii]
MTFEAKPREDHVTNTIIVTSVSQLNVTDSEQVKLLNEWLALTVLQQYTITNDNALQLIILKNFKRILLISPTHEISKSIMDVSRDLIVSKFKFSYSLTDTSNSLEKQYLELPKGERLFLISPPTSPPPGFDYSRCEEVPNTESVSKTHLTEQPHLYDVINDDGKDLNNQQPREITLLDCNTGKIVVNTCKNYDDPNVESKLIPTSMPPKSIFDDDEDLLTDIDDE